MQIELGTPNQPNPARTYVRMFVCYTSLASCRRCRVFLCPVNFGRSYACTRDSSALTLGLVLACGWWKRDDCVANSDGGDVR